KVRTCLRFMVRVCQIGMERASHYALDFDGPPPLSWVCNGAIDDRRTPMWSRSLLAPILLAGPVLFPAADTCAQSTQNWPIRPITIVAGVAAGGPTDTIARVVADRMQISLGRPVIIENMTGAAGSLAVGRVVRAAPDGYTISIGQWGTRVANG